MANDVRKTLIKMGDLEYKLFHEKLMPNVKDELVIGIRVPKLREFSKQFFKSSDVWDFCNDLPHKYYEENNLHGLIINQITNYDECIKELDKFLPYVDNWATCDLISPKIFKKNLDKLSIKAKEWIKSDKTYVTRFGIRVLMNYYLGDNLKKEYLDIVASVDKEDYYVKMMVAWFFATALFKNYDDAILYLEQKKLDKWTHNKTIQKAIDSRRVSEKDYLKKLRR